MHRRSPCRPVGRPSSLRAIVGTVLALALALPGASLAAPGSASAQGGPGGGGGAPASASLQSDGRGVRATDRRFDIEHLALDLEVDVVGRTIAGTATHTLRPLRTGLKELRLHAVGLDVSRVTVDGAQTTFRLRPEQLVIDLPAPSDPAKSHTVAITYSAAPQLGLHFRAPGPDSPDTHHEVWSQGEDEDNRWWFPTWDEPDDRFTYTGAFTVADRFTAVSNGRLTSRDAPKPGWTRWTYELTDQDLVSYLVMFAAAEYRLAQDAWRDRPVLAYGPPSRSQEALERSVARTKDMLDFMSSATGVEYPYPGYTQVFVQRFLYTGMENTTATIMEEAQLHPPELAPQRERRVEAVVAHELAHQWFGDQLTCRDWSHMWLNEGLTRFLETWWWTYAHGPEEGAHKQFAGVAYTVRAEKRGAKPLVVDFYTREGERQSHNVYSKGSAVMQGLRVLLGEADFGRAFRRYVADHQHAMVTTEDLRRSFEDTTGLDLSWYFQQWAYLAGHPVLTVKHAVDAEQGTVRIDLAQTQDVGGNVPLFVLPVDLDVSVGGAVVRRRVWLDGKEASLVLDAPAGVDWVAVDPDGGLLADIQQEQTDAEWLSLLGSGATAYSKRLAWHALSQKESASDALRQAVVTVLMDPSAHRVWRHLAADVLGGWKDDGSVAALVGALGSLAGSDGPGAGGIAQDPALQGAIAEALAEAKGNEVAGTALKVLHQRGANLLVRATALNALGAVDSEAALPLARAALKQPGGWNNSHWRYAVDILGKHGDRKDLDRLAPLRQPSMFHWTRASALRASARIANREPVGKERDAARRVVAADAEANLADLHLRGLQTVIGVLSSIGDEESVAALEGVRATSTISVIRDRITKTIEAIRTRKEKDPDGQSEDGGALTAKVKTAEDKLKDLEERLKALEETR